MKKILLVLLLGLVLVGCGAEDKQSETSTGDSEAGEVTSESDEGESNRIYKSGEEVIIENANGEDMYSLKIDSATTANDFEYKSDFPESTEQVIEIDYTYKNINKDDIELYIHGADLQVLDQDGFVAESSSMFPKQTPQEIGVGASCRVQSYYGLSRESEKIQVVFKSLAYDKTLTFEVPVS